MYALRDASGLSPSGGGAGRLPVRIWGISRGPPSSSSSAASNTPVLPSTSATATTMDASTRKRTIISGPEEITRAILESALDIFPPHVRHRNPFGGGHGLPSLARLSIGATCLTSR